MEGKGAKDGRAEVGQNEGGWRHEVSGGGREGTWSVEREA